MGVDLVGRTPWAADFFEEAKAVSGLDIFDLCTNGPAEELDQVQNQLVCTVVASGAARRALAERGLQPDCVAGFGIGEYAAHVIAGTADLETVLTLAARMAALGAMAAHVAPGGSAYLKDITPEEAQALCERCDEGGGLFVSALCCPGTVMVAGREEPLAAALAEHEAAGKAVQCVNCTAPLNTPLMQSAASGMGMALKHTLFGPAQVPVYNNLDGAPFDHMRLPELLGGAVTAPVMWEKTLNALFDAGVDRVVQVGPGGMLLEMAQAVAAQRGLQLKTARAATVEDIACISI